MLNPIKRLLELIKCKNLLQWENYASNAGHCLNDVDEKLFALNRRQQKLRFLSERDEELWAKQSVRTLVASDEPIAALRNKIDNWDNYPAKNREELAKLMRPDVEKLFSLRQERAKEMGFDSYPELVFAYEELSFAPVQKVIDDYFQGNHSNARRIVEKYSLQQSTWFSQLAEISAEERSIDAFKELDRVAKVFGIEEELEKVTIVVSEQAISGVVFAIDPPADVRMLLSPITSSKQLRTFYHELGHCMAAICNKEQGLSRLFTTVYDEVMAVIFEKIAIHALMDEVTRKKLAQIEVVEGVRLALSHCFEQKLWKTQDFAKAEEWFIDSWAKLEVAVDKPSLWAIDSFRSIDPVYVHNYVLGEYFGRLFVQQCEQRFGRDYRAWFRYLKSQLLSDGMARTFDSKMAFLI